MEKFEKFLNEKSKELMNVHWNKTVDIYSKNSEMSKYVLENLMEEDYFKNHKENFSQIQKEISKFADGCQNPEYQIAIVGAIKAGKSTLINSLIGHKLASVDVTPETATLTKFKHTKKNTLRVKFYNKQEWESIWKDANDKNAQVFLEEYKNLNSESVKNEYLGKEEVILTYEDIDSLKSDIKKWTSSKEKEHYFVKEIEIGLSDLKLPEQVCLVDTPGLNDVVAYRSNITLDYIDNANAIIICVNSKTLRNEEFLTIARVFSKAKYKKDKVYILGTQIDTMNSIEDWEKQRLEWLKYLRAKECYGDAEIACKQLIGISAYSHSIVENRNEINIETYEDLVGDMKKKQLITRDEKRTLEKLLDEKKLDSYEIKNFEQKVLEFSKVNYIRKIIERELLSNYNEVQLKDIESRYNTLKSRINSVAKDHIKAINNHLKELEMNDDEIEKVKIEKEENLKKLRGSIKDMNYKVHEVKQSFNSDFSELKNGFEELKRGINSIKIK